MKIKSIHNRRSSEGSALYILIMPIIMVLLMPSLAYVAMIPAKKLTESRSNQVTSYESKVQAYMLEGNYINAVSLPSQDDIEDLISGFSLTDSDQCFVSDFDDSDDQLSGKIVCQKNDQSNSSDFLITLLSDGDDLPDDDDDPSFPYDGEYWKKNGMKSSQDPCDTGTNFSSNGRYSRDHIEQYFDADPEFSNGGISKWCYKLDS